MGLTGLGVIGFTGMRSRELGDCHAPTVMCRWATLILLATAVIQILDTPRRAMHARLRERGAWLILVVYRHYA